MVVAPHPDDEALIASGVLLRAVQRHEPVAVIILTNGDYDCHHEASQRQAESVAGLAALGVQEDQIFFLGYPDGYLARLGEEPLPELPRLQGGQCGRGDKTYGSRGAGRRDVHSSLAGAPGLYTATNLLFDLGYLLQRMAPRTLVVTHPEDTHPDHAAAYAFVRRALSGAARAPRILRALVHNGDCWPTGSGHGQDCPAGRIAPPEATPALSGSLRGYLPNLRVPVPASCLLEDVSRNPKLCAISAHASQTRGSPDSYLLAFARRDEIFFSEDLVRDAKGNWAPGPAPRAAGQPTFLLRGHESLSFKQHEPLALGVVLARPEAAQLVRVSFLESATGRYVLTFDGAQLRVLLSKETGSGSELLQEWLLPHDSWQPPHHRERFELQVAVRTRGARATELTLLRGDDVVGVAVDVHGLTAGQRLGVEDDQPGSAGVQLSVSAHGR